MEATNGQDGFKLSKRRGDDGNSYDVGTELILLSAQSKDAEVPPSPRLPDTSFSNIETVPEAVLPSSRSRGRVCSAGRSAIHYHRHNHHVHYHHRHYHYKPHPKSQVKESNGSSSDTASPMVIKTV